MLLALVNIGLDMPLVIFSFAVGFGVFLGGAFVADFMIEIVSGDESGEFKRVAAQANPLQMHLNGIWLARPFAEISLLLGLSGYLWFLQNAFFSDETILKRAL